MDGFEPDASVQAMVEACGLDMVDFAKAQFDIDLDWSEASITHLEEVADALHHAMATDAPSDADVDVMHNMLGSYLGEVYRRSHGGEWGIVTLETKSFYGMRSADSQHVFWPMGKALARLRDGSENNLLVYYRGLINS